VIGLHLTTLPPVDGLFDVAFEAAYDGDARPLVVIGRSLDAVRWRTTSVGWVDQTSMFVCS
jgi:hypothetical protein